MSQGVLAEHFLSITLPPLTWLFIKYLMVPFLPQVFNMHATGHPHDVTENLIKQTNATFFSCPMVQFLCWHTHPRHFRLWILHNMGALTGLWQQWQHSPICNELWCNVCSDTFLLEPAFAFSAICATVALLLNYTTLANLHSLHVIKSLGYPDPCWRGMLETF